MQHRSTEEAVPLMEGDSERWLDANRDLRMDANRELWAPARRAFHLDRYRFAREFCRNRRVLDGACGTGYGTAILAETAETAVGIDMSEEAVRYATQYYGRDKVRFEVSFVEYTPFEAHSFDLVVSFETVEHTLCPKSHVKEISRLLAPEGKAILSVPNSWGYTDHHFFDFDGALLQETAEPYFGRIELYAQSPGTLADPEAGRIEPLNADTALRAQCIVAVCSGPKPVAVDRDRLKSVMSEIYENAFDRHQEFRALLYRQDTPIARRVLNRVQLIRSRLRESVWPK